MFRIIKQQKEGSVLLQEVDSYLFAEELKVEDDKIVLSLETQRLFITENLRSFRDIGKILKDLERLENTTIHLIDPITKEEIDVEIKIEGGI